MAIEPMPRCWTCGKRADEHTGRHPFVQAGGKPEAVATKRLTGADFVRIQDERDEARVEVERLRAERDEARADLKPLHAKLDPWVERNHDDGGTYEEALDNLFAAAEHLGDAEAAAYEARVERDEALALLRRVEWVGDGPETYCEVCGGWDHIGHADGCALAALLAKHDTEGELTDGAS